MADEFWSPKARVQNWNFPICGTSNAVQGLLSLASGIVLYALWMSNTEKNRAPCRASSTSSKRGRGNLAGLISALTFLRSTQKRHSPEGFFTNTTLLLWGLTDFSIILFCNISLIFSLVIRILLLGLSYARASSFGCSLYSKSFIILVSSEQVAKQSPNLFNSDCNSLLSYSARFGFSNGIFTSFPLSDFTFRG